MFFSIPSASKQIIANTPIGAKSIRYLFFQNKNDGLFQFKEQPDRISISIDGRQICRNLLVLPFCTGAPDGAQVRRWQDVAIEVNMNVNFSEIKIDGGADNDYNIVFVCSDEKVDESRGFEFWETKSVRLKNNITKESIISELTNAYDEAERTAIENMEAAYFEQNAQISEAREELAEIEDQVTQWQSYCERFVDWYDELYSRWISQEFLAENSILRAEYEACVACISTDKYTAADFRPTGEELNAAQTEDFSEPIAPEVVTQPTEPEAPHEPDVPELTEPEPPGENPTEEEQQAYDTAMNEYEVAFNLWQQYRAYQKEYTDKLWPDYEDKQKVYEAYASANEAYVSANEAYTDRTTNRNNAIAQNQQRKAILDDFLQQLNTVHKWIREQNITNLLSKISSSLSGSSFSFEDEVTIKMRKINSTEFIWFFRNTEIILTAADIYQYDLATISQKDDDESRDICEQFPQVRYVDEEDGGFVYDLSTRISTDVLLDPRAEMPSRPTVDEIGADVVAAQSATIATAESLTKSNEQIREELSGKQYTFVNPFTAYTAPSFTRTREGLTTLAETLFAALAAKQDTFFGQENPYTFDYSPRKFFALNIIKPISGTQLLTLTAPLNISISGTDNEALPKQTDLCLFTATDPMPHALCEHTFEPEVGVHRSLTITIGANCSPDKMQINQGAEQWILYMFFGYRKIV